MMTCDPQVPRTASPDRPRRRRASGGPPGGRGRQAAARREVWFGLCLALAAWPGLAQAPGQPAPSQAGLRLLVTEVTGSQAGLPLALRVAQPKDLRDEVKRLERVIEVAQEQNKPLGFLARQQMKMSGQKVPRSVPLDALEERADFFDGQLVGVSGVATAATEGGPKTFMLGGPKGVRVQLAPSAQVLGVEQGKQGAPTPGSRVEITGTVRVSRQTTRDGSEVVRSVLEATKVAPSVSLTALQIARTYEICQKWPDAAKLYEGYGRSNRSDPYAVHASVRAGRIYEYGLGDEKDAAKAYTSAWDAHSQARSQRTQEPVVWVYHPQANRWETAAVRATISAELEAINQKNPLYQIMNQFAHLAGGRRGDPALGVILLAFVTRILIFPLTLKQMKSAQEMARLQPQMKELQARFKDDKAKLQQETWKMFREHGVSPLGGCLPMLIQFPILIALYRGIRMYIVRFDQTHLTIIPGVWNIPNLADPDMILLLLYTVSQVGFQILTQRLQPPPSDPQQQQTQKMMTWMMPVMFFMFFRTLPAAFILYWLATNVIYCAMQMYMTKRMQQEQAGGGTGKPAEKPARRGLIETIMPGLGARARKADPKPGASSGGGEADESRKSLAEKEQAERKLHARGRPRRKGPRK